MAFLQLHFQSLLLIIILAHLITFELVHGLHHQELPKFVNGGRRHYIVHMDSSSKPQPFTSHHSWYSSLLSTSTSSSSNAFLNDGSGAEAISTSSAYLSSPELVYTYENSMKGFTALLSDDHLRQLKLHPAFISAFPDSFGTLETTHSYKFLGLDEVSGVWPASKFGEDVIIGVVDTGVWPESKSFRDDGMPDVPKRWRGRCESGQAFNVSNCNRKLIGARFFNKGIFAENPNSTVSMNSARDTDGHGTHTASTAAGSFVSGASYFNYARGTARGMAPRARLAVYKVFWDAGVTTSDTIAAIDQAIADGVDVISLSMSFRRVPLHEDGIAIGSFAAMEKGIFVAAAAGNRGPSHRTVRNGIPWILTVAASNIDRKYSGIVTLGNGVTLTGSSLYIGNTSFLSKTNKIPLYYNLSNADCNSGGIDPEENNVTKKVVVCEITDDASSIIGESGLATTIGAAGALLLTRDTLYTEKNKNYEIPAAVLDPKESDIVRKYLNTSKNPAIIFKFGRTIIRTKPAPTLAMYSSRGPSFGSPTVLKPDLMAPGSMILAAYPSNVSVVKVRGKELFSDFNLLYGTSMATPHASGVASLLKSVHPEWSPAAIRSAMMTTADTLDNTGQRIKDGAFTTTEATGLRMGSGHINPIKAMDPGLVYDANRGDYVKFLCSLNYTREEFMTVARNSTEYGICNNTGSEELFNLNYPSFIAFYNNEETTGVHTFKRTLTNVGEGGFVYTAGLTSMKGFKVSVRPTRLVFRKKGDRVPFVLTLEIVKPMKTDLVEGSLTWVDAKGKHIVRSPMVATTTREVED